MEEESQE
jgi:U3 small nucleolar RNA-associated protein MPP10